MQFLSLQLLTSNLWPPTISIIIPTLNSAETLEDCLESIAMQDYPKDKIEIIIADGGSTDGTLEIISEFSDASNLQPQTSNCSFSVSNLKPQTLNIQIVSNNLKTGEAGKAVGVRAAKNEIIAFVDSDNILNGKDWLRKMVEPFEDSEIVGSEPLYYTYRESDSLITRYCALMGMNDPLCYFIGNYDRFNYLTGTWTRMPVGEWDEGPYLKISFDKKALPTIGANGFLVRRNHLLSCTIGDYLFDIDVVCELLNSNRDKFAKVKVGIVHIFSGDVSTFARKQRRRVRDYLYYSKQGLRRYPWGGFKKRGLLKFVLYSIFVFPLFGQAILGYAKKRDRAWFFHPIACLVTLWVYGAWKIRDMIGIGSMEDREKWSLNEF